MCDLCEMLHDWLNLMTISQELYILLDRIMHGYLLRRFASSIGAIGIRRQETR